LDSTREVVRPLRRSSPAWSFLGWYSDGVRCRCERHRGAYLASGALAITFAIMCAALITTSVRLYDGRRDGRIAAMGLLPVTKAFIDQGG
jgi:hypothetical protein